MWASSARFGAPARIASDPATVERAARVVLPGVGSAVNDTTRELGGTLGVAIIGSAFHSGYADALRSGTGLASLPAPPRPAATRPRARGRARGSWRSWGPSSGTGMDRPSTARRPGRATGAAASPGQGAPDQRAQPGLVLLAGHPDDDRGVVRIAFQHEDTLGEADARVAALTAVVDAIAEQKARLHHQSIGPTRSKMTRTKP